MALTLKRMENAMSIIPKHPRTVNVQQLNCGLWEMTITENLATKSHITKYLLEDIHDAPALSVWRVEKFFSTKNDQGEGKYTVEICNDIDHSSCTCKGYEHGHCCRHIKALHALIEDGQLPGLPGADYYDLDELEDLDTLESLEAEWHQGHDWE